MKRLVLNIVMVLSVVAPSTAWAADDISVVVGQRGFWDTSVVELGAKQGIFEKHGLTPQITYSKGGGETIQAVISGSADIGVAAGALGVISAFSKGAPLRIIGAEITGSANYWIVPANSTIKTIKDMDGKKVAISTVGSGTHAVALTAARDNGIKPEIVPTGTVPATYTALMSGQIDVGFAVPPFAFDSIDKGEVRMLFKDNDLDSIRKQSSRVIITNLNTNDSVIERFLEAYTETVEWMYQGEEPIKAFAALTNTDVKSAERVRDEFYPKKIVLPQSLAGLDLVMKDAVEFGFMKVVLTPEQLATLTEKAPR